MKFVNYDVQKQADAKHWALMLNELDIRSPETAYNEVYAD